jgi:pseudouridine synthase
LSQRLNLVLARAGVASRRAADRLIAEGRIRVNGSIVTALGSRVDPERDRVTVDGRALPAAPRRHTYLMLHKPRGCVTTLSDPEGRPTVLGLLRGVTVRVFPVGRLDYQSEGLLLLTDDGELARALMHPSSGVTKTYRAKVRGVPEADSLARLARGVRVDGRPTQPAQVSLLRRTGSTAWVELVLHEGRKRQVRRMLEAIGHPVQRLRRTRYDGLELGALPAGRFRPLTAREVALLRSSARLKTPRRSA